MNPRRYITLALALCLVVSLFAGCGSNPKVKNLRIDENGVASWNPMDGAVAYHCDLFYKEGDSDVGAGGFRIKDTSLTVPYGCGIMVAPVMADGSMGSFTKRVYYGDENNPDIAAFFAILDSIHSDQELQDGVFAEVDTELIDGNRASCSMNFPQDLVEGSVASQGSALTFQLRGSDGRTVTYQSDDAWMDGSEIVLNPGAKLWSRDAIGRIITAYVETRDFVELEHHLGYSFAGDTIDSTAELYELAWQYGTLTTVGNMEPNFYWAESPATEPVRIVTMQFGYEPGLTGLSTVEFDRSYFPEYLVGDLYDESIESRWDPENGIFDFYLLLKPDTPAASFENNIHSVWGTENYTVGDLKDADGNAISKSEPLPEGATLEVSLGDYTVDVPVTMPQNTTARNLYETLPVGYAQSTGTLNTLVIPVVFADLTERATEANLATMKSALGRIVDEQGNVTEHPAPREDLFSLSDYFDTASFGQLDIRSFVTDWYYSPLYYTDVYNIPLNQTQVVEMVEWAKDSYPHMDWSEFDKDGNGLFDSVIFFIAGDTINDNFFPAGTSGAHHMFFEHVDNNPGTPEDPGVNGFINMSMGLLFDNVTISDDTAHLTYRTLVHEFGHNLGLVDYYDVSYSGINAVGGYDMQSSNAGDWNSYSKYAVGWIEPIVVTEESFAGADSIELTIGSAPLTGDAIVIPAAGADITGTPLDEYILIDLFTPEGLHQYDAAQYGPGNISGVRIYHVDARYVQRTLTNNEGEETVIGTIARSNSMGYHADHGGQFLIELIQAGGDNTFTQLEKDEDGIPINRTWVMLEDFFQAGDVFTAEGYSEFFHNGLMDTNVPFGYKVEILSIADGNATIRITKQ